MGFRINKRRLNYNYFDEFEKNANYSLECAKMLYEILTKYDNDDLTENLKNIHEIERKADDSKHVMVNYLVKDFLPPIEREDILNLSQEIDDVTDYIEEILINVDMFNVKVMRPEVTKFLEILLNCCQKECELINKFKNFKKIDDVKKLVIEINRLEEDGDSLYTNSMKKLYQDGTETIEVIKWTTIFNCFENTFDTCEHVANDVESIMLKNL